MCAARKLHLPLVAPLSLLVCRLAVCPLISHSISVCVCVHWFPLQWLAASRAVQGNSTRRPFLASLYVQVEQVVIAG